EDDRIDDRPWVVIVWNDPINLMSYVTLVLQKLFGYSKAKSTKLMLQVHNEGKAVVSSGTREKAELDVSRLHAHGLWATMRQDWRCDAGSEGARTAGTGWSFRTRSATSSPRCRASCARRSRRASRPSTACFPRRTPTTTRRTRSTLASSARPFWT